MRKFENLLREPVESFQRDLKLVLLLLFRKKMARDSGVETELNRISRTNATREKESEIEECRKNMDQSGSSSSEIHLQGGVDAQLLGCF